MLVRIVKLHFHPENLDTFEAVFESVKDKIAGFPGCSGVQLLKEKKEGNIYFTYSHWTSETALNNYRHSSLFKETWAKTKILFSHKPEAWSVHLLSEAK